MCLSDEVISLLVSAGDDWNSSSPGRYQRLDLFIKVLMVLCLNLTDAANIMKLMLVLASV